MAWVALSVGLYQCRDVEPPEASPDAAWLRINEVVSNNEGVWVDESGQTDDYIELLNTGSRPAPLKGLVFEDGGGRYPLPDMSVAPGQTLLLWADDDLKQGPNHLAFKISSKGEPLRLLRPDGSAIDSVLVPALAEHQAYVRMPDGSGSPSVCDWATPGRSNGARCGPSAPSSHLEHVEFAPYAWPETWPEPAAPLVITRLALRPAEFVEVTNTSTEPVVLADYQLRLAPHAPGLVLPDALAGTSVAWPKQVLEAGQSITVPVTDEDVASIQASAHFQGLASLFSTQSAGALVDRLEFSDWPEGAKLERDAGERQAPRFCEASTAEAGAEPCRPLPKREVGSYMNRLLTPGDFEALARGRSDLGIDSVEFLVDMSAGDSVTFLNSRDWDLHYSFVREVIQHQFHLNRCIPEEKAQFEQGWQEFSQQEYFRVEGRRYLLGTLVRYASNQLLSVEFSPGDVISAEQMKRAFFAVMKRVPDARAYSIRPQAPDQIQRLRQVEGQVPIVGPSAAFEGVTFQALAPGLSFGALRFVPADRLREEGVGPRDIIITDQVPNDLPLVGGLITEVFQTPLSHVNVLSRGRGTPNAALPNARQDPRVQPLLGELVRFEVHGGTFSIEKADPLEASRFFEMQKPKERLVPRLDLSVRGLASLDQRSFEDLPAIGGKAAQFAELSRVSWCGTAGAPENAFAIPVGYSIDHFDRSGARAELQRLREQPGFASDPRERAAGLAHVRELIESTPLDPELDALLQSAIAARLTGKSLRFRSSSNVEDLAGFNGAGLYTSVGVDDGDLEDGVARAVRRVWASLWNDRAYAERDFYNVDQDAVGMGVLVHEGFPSERANGVAISRNVLEPTRADVYYVNAQLGEALVTNPAPGIQSDEFTYSRFGYEKFVYQQRSTFSPLRPVLSEEEVSLLACNLSAIHESFRSFLDPERKNPAFAVDIEFKFVGAERRLVIKQARSFALGKSVPDSWCDF
ncbi:MAG TPA: PEP/pyruvate-binding domain-containing protein [Polyangiaceae bacterium]|nr:PEP/pyruvate-binding domain-containing protein [Polyangiaceae bacterium]